MTNAKSLKVGRLNFGISIFSVQFGGSQLTVQETLDLQNMKEALPLQELIGHNVVWYINCKMNIQGLSTQEGVLDLYTIGAYNELHRYYACEQKGE